MMHGPWPISIDVQPEMVRPSGDFVLVRRLDLEPAGVWVPRRSQRAMMQLRLGLVVAVGPGDPVVTLRCSSCGKERDRIGVLRHTHADHLREPVRTGTCSCGETECEVVKSGRAPMQVRVGDRVLYWRSPANDVVIGGQRYIFLHEEQHIVAVVE
jgi:co-chaperonin GroES (HSP10)